MPRFHTLFRLFCKYELCHKPCFLTLLNSSLHSHTGPLPSLYLFCDEYHSHVYNSFSLFAFFSASLFKNISLLRWGFSSISLLCPQYQDQHSAGTCPILCISKINAQVALANFQIHCVLLFSSFSSSLFSLSSMEEKARYQIGPCAFSVL